MKRGAIVLVLLVMGLMLHGATGPIGAQWAQEALTQEEAAAARSFAEQFTRRMTAARDAMPLIPDFFVPEVCDDAVQLRTVKQTDVIVNRVGFFLFFPADALIRQPMSRADACGLFIQTLNFWYLATLEIFSRSPDAFNGSLAGALPPDVVMVLQADPDLGGLLNSRLATLVSDVPASRSGKRTIESLADVRRAVGTLERAAAALRRAVSDPLAEERPAYKAFVTQYGETLVKVGGGPSLLARATLCGARCGRLPAGTRFLEIVALPFLHLHLVRHDGALKIAYVDLPTD